MARETRATRADLRLSPQPHRRTPKAFASKHNADAHLKRQIMGREVVVAITKNKLDSKARPLLRIRYGGPWEQIFYGEFDGRRRKRVLVKIIGE